jgi:ATP-binding cassette, subfamily C, bacterial
LLTRSGCESKGVHDYARNTFAVSKSVVAKLLGPWIDDTLRAYTVTLMRFMSWKFVLALALMISLTLTQGAQLVLLVPLMQVVGLDVQQGSVGWVAEFVSSAFAVVGLRPTLVPVLVFFVLVSSLLALLRRRQTMFNFRLQMDFVAWLRRRLYGTIANTNWLTFSKIRSSDFTHVLTTELDRVGGATHYILGFIANIIMVTVYVVLALRLSVTMTAMVFIAGITLLLLLQRKTRTARVTGEDITFATNGLYSAAIEHLAGMKTTKSYGAEERNIRLFSGLADRVAQMQLKSLQNYAETGFWFTVGSMVILSSIVYVSFNILELPAAAFLLLLFLFNRMIPLFNAIQQNFQQYLNALPAFERVMEIEARCETEPEPMIRQGKAEVFELRDSVRFEGISFSYGSEEKTSAVRDLTFAIEGGQTTAIVGPSGAGKSTVADLALGLIAPDEGRILVDGKQLVSEQLKSWRNRIGYVAQDTFMFNDTVRANLLWASPDATEADIVRALELSAGEFVFELPDGINTVLGDRGMRLSGGERQRLALARALLRNPSLLILDEATSALDSENELRIQDAIEKLHGHMTILVITHRLSSIRGADVIHVLERGRLVESGDWDTLLDRRDSRFGALCRAQGIGGTTETAGSNTSGAPRGRSLGEDNRSNEGSGLNYLTRSGRR